MDSWNVYSQNTPGTPNSTWLCPQNNSSDWLHPQNNVIERERNENTTALATPTRYVMEYNDVNQNTSSGSYYGPYAQEMEKLFENNFLKIGNPEDLLDNDIYNNNNLSSWLNTNETVVSINTNNPITTKSKTNSPTSSLITDIDQDQLSSTTSASFIRQYPITTSAQVITTIPQSLVVNGDKTKSVTTSPISSRVSKEDHYPMTTYSSGLSFPQNSNDQYLQTKKYDPKQLLLPLTTSSASIDGTMTAVSITSPTSSIGTDDDDMNQFNQSAKDRRQSYYQDFPLNAPTNDLPMQQPSPELSEISSNEKTPPPSNETTPKQKKRRVLQRKMNKKIYENTLISPVENSYPSRGNMTTETIEESSESEETSYNKDSADNSNSTEPNSSDSMTDSCKRDNPDDGHDETPEEKRARLLERNRIAAAKCRQKKKQAQECLQQQASDLTQKNTTMHSLVNDLREEALKLKNQLLAHSTCNCNVIQEYVRTSGQFAFARASYTK